MWQSIVRCFLRCAFMTASVMITHVEVAPAQTPGPSTSQSSKPTNISTSVSLHRTPADRILKPFMISHPLSKAVPASKGALPMNGDSLGTPAFAGYLTAPMYNATNTASRPYSNSGVSLEIGGDFDKDGKMDMAILQLNGTLNILMNDGKQGVKAPVSYLNPYYETSKVPIAYAVDINGDGYLDIAAFDISNNTTIVWPNLGNGQFGAAIITPVDTTYGFPDTVLFADVNHDGKADLLFGMMTVNSRTSATVYLETQLGAGDGTFGVPSGAKVESFSYAAAGIMPFNAAIAVGDINGDGVADIAVSIDERDSTYEGAYVVATAIGNNDGSFSGLGSTFPISVPAEQTLLYDPAVAYYTSILALSDINGDGKLDLVADINGALVTAAGAGDGTFGPLVTSDISGVEDPQHTVLADVNGDGKLDAIVAGSTLGVFPGNGDGSFDTSKSGEYVVDPAAGYSSLVVADFNGDGVVDIAESGSYYRQVSFFYNNGKGSFQGAPMVLALNDPSPLDTVPAAIGRFTSSGLTTPLFYHSNRETLNLYSLVSDNEGNQNWVQALPNLLFEYVEPIAADFNGDGLDDLVYADVTGGLWVALSKGDGTFGTPVSAGLPTTACSLNFGSAGDINGDGKLDIVVTYGGDVPCDPASNGPSGYYVLLGKGDGTFNAPTFVTIGAELYQAKLADLDGDGNLDLILNDLPAVFQSGYQVSYLRGKGDGTFGDPIPLLQDYVVADIEIGDINHDGKLDLVAAEAQVVNDDIATAGLLVLPGNGDGTFGAPATIAGGSYFSDVRIADMNNDGNPDLVATLANAVPAVDYYGLVTLLGYGNGLFAAPYNALESTASESPLIADFNNDGTLDVISYANGGSAYFIGVGGSSLTLTGSAPSISAGQTETLTASIKASLAGRPPATGTISFYDGATLLGQAAISDGVATFPIASLGAGSHTLKAVYAGDSNFNPATSATVSVTVAALAPDFSLAGSSTSLSVTGGAQGVATLNVAANATFSGAVTLSCAGMPANGTCTVNPATVALTPGGTGTATLLIGTTATHADLLDRDAPWNTMGKGVSFAATFFLIFGRRRRLLKANLFMLLLLVPLASVVTGCGGGNDKSKSAITVKPGSYALTITATPPQGSNVNTQTYQVSLTVN